MCKKYVHGPVVHEEHVPALPAADQMPFQVVVVIIIILLFTQEEFSVLIFRRSEPHLLSLLLLQLTCGCIEGHYAPVVGY